MEKTKKKHKFNAVDAAIIIVLAALIVAAVFFFRGGDDASASLPKVQIEYKIEFSAVPDEFTDYFIIGDTVTDSVGLYKIGQIVDVQITSAIYNGTALPTGELVSSEYPDVSDVVVTVSAEAIIGENGRYILGGGYELIVGSTVNMRTPSFNGAAYCIGINQLEGDAK